MNYFLSAIFFSTSLAFAASSKKCINDPVAWIAKRGGGITGAKVTFNGPDREIFSKHLLIEIGPCGASGNCMYELYLENNGCFRLVGEFGGQGPVILKTSHNGMRDLSDSWKNGDSIRSTEYWFDGQRYQKEKETNHPLPPITDY